MPLMSSWNGTARSLGSLFSRTVVLRYRIHLESRHLAPGTINLHLEAVRRSPTSRRCWLAKSRTRGRYPACERCQEAGCEAWELAHDRGSPSLLAVACCTQVRAQTMRANLGHPWDHHLATPLCQLQSLPALPKAFRSSRHRCSRRSRCLPAPGRADGCARHRRARFVHCP